MNTQRDDPVYDERRPNHLTHLTVIFRCFCRATGMWSTHLYIMLCSEGE